MIEKILLDVVDGMTPYLNREQMERLKDVLYINFHNIEVKEECYELQPSSLSGNELKLKMFLASKKAINCQDETLKGYATEIRNVLGGICFVALGLINEVIPWEMPLWQQVLIGAGIITALEFMTGCIVNLWLGWAVWDYSGLPGNIFGQICPQFFLLWLPVAMAAIMLDDWMRYWWFGEERPHYKISKKGGIKGYG